MEITRLTRLLHADEREVADLIAMIECADGDERARLLERLPQALHLAPAAAGTSREPHANDGALSSRTEVADAVAADLGLD
jgi:hypothetical protein